MISGTVGQIVGLVLAYSVLIGSELEENELLVPLVIFYQGGDRKIEEFEAESQQEAVLLGQEFLKCLSDKADRTGPCVNVHLICRNYFNLNEIASVSAPGHYN